MLEAGIKVGIATDSVASNNNLDMFEEMRIATLLQKVFTKMQQHYQLKQLFLLRQKEPEVIGMKQTGSLEAGKCADFITIDPSNKSSIYNQQMKCYHTLYMPLVEKI